MAYSTTARNAMLDHLASLIDFVSIHSAYPGTTGTDEISGGSPAYARQSVTWNAASGGAVTAVSDLVFDVALGTTTAWVGFWSAVSGGTYYGSTPVEAGLAVPFQARATDDIFTAESHGLVDLQSVVLVDTQGATIPGGFVEGTTYYVRDATVDTFKLAATSGGSAVDVTADGAGFVQNISVYTFTDQGTLTLTSITLDLLL